MGKTKTPKEIQQRREKNIISARNSRERTRQLIESLTDANTKLKQENAMLVASFESFKEQAKSVIEQSSKENNRRIDHVMKTARDEQLKHQAIVTKLKQELFELETVFELRKLSEPELEIDEFFAPMR